MNKLFRKIIPLALAASSLIALLSACGQQETETEEEGDELSTEISGEVLTAGNAVDHVFSLCCDTSVSLNPITTTNSLNQMVDDLVYDRLFEIDSNFNISSRILSDWYYNSEANAWVLTVRDDIPMHDGSMLTAEDVVYSISRVFSQGATYYQRQLGTVYSSASGNDVYIMSNTPNALQIYRMAVPIIKSGGILDNTPVGSGPYKFSEDLSCLEKFDDYADSDLLPVDKIYLQPYTDAGTMITDYENALIDLVVNDQSSIYNKGYGGKNEKRVFNTTNLHYIAFNSESEFFSYDQYRAVMTYLIDRDTIVEEALNGAGTATAIPIHPASSLFDSAYNDSLSYDMDRAKEELEKLGCRDLDGDGMLEYALSGSKVDLTIRFVVCADVAAKVQAAKSIAENMRAVGLDVTLEELSWEDYKTALDEGEFDLYYAESIITPDWSTLSLFETLEDEENVTNLNYGRWSRSDAEDAVNAFLAADDETRADAETTMLTTLAENAMFIPICFEQREAISHLGVIKGMNPNQYSLFCGMTNWTIDLDS